MDGGAGADTASYAAAAGGVTVDLSVTTTQNTGAAGVDTLRGFEHLVGSNFADTLTGNALANSLSGGGGDDSLGGGDGNDRLVGGSGSDVLSGGQGADTFIFNSRLGTDRVTDFSIGGGADKLAISQAGVRIGNGDLVIDGFTTVLGPGGFSPSAELVVVQSNIIGAFGPASAAAAIGAATVPYAIGSTVLFAVDDGIATTGLFLFTSSAADATVSPAELTAIAEVFDFPLNGVGIGLADYVFVA
jgi:hypothetical protein